MDMPVKKIVPTMEAYAELQMVYDVFNDRLFDGELPGALIVMTRRKNSYGYFSFEQFANKDGINCDEIAMNSTYFAVRSVEEVLSTLAHEMVHQWQYRLGKPSKRGYHDTEFMKKMESIGLITSHTGYPGGHRVGEHMTHYIAEGGRFIQVCNELLQDSFGIIWFDRYPAPVIMEPPSTAHLEQALSSEGQGKKTEPAMASGLDLGSEGTEFVDGEPIPPPEGGEEQKKKRGGRKAALATAAPAMLSMPVITQSGTLASNIGVTVEEPGDDGQGSRVSAVLSGGNAKVKSASGARVKYRCPVCRVAVWGKAGLRVLCGAEGCASAVME